MNGMVATVTINGKPVRYFSSPDITMGGKPYRIVGTTLTGRGVYDAIDTVKNEAGELKEFDRLKLLNMCT